mmetsp:Transcript_33463/g.52027  ORF Transcript_33463/g.52027 Transcript_33463/m.52027 type:complete len:145 (-) Transcript_33463:35-469(-)
MKIHDLFSFTAILAMFTPVENIEDIGSQWRTITDTKNETMVENILENIINLFDNDKFENMRLEPSAQILNELQNCAPNTNSPEEQGSDEPKGLKYCRKGVLSPQNIQPRCKRSTETKLVKQAERIKISSNGKQSMCSDNSNQVF